MLNQNRGSKSPYEKDERPGHSPNAPINVEQEEGMEGVVDGIGTLMLDPLGRESKSSTLQKLISEYIGESASAAFHRKVREYVQSQRPGARLGGRYPEPHDPTELVDLVNADEPPDATAQTPGVVGASPRSTFSSSPMTLRGRLPPRHLADSLIDRFFKQVHSIFWVFPPDQFLRRLDKTYLFYDFDLYGDIDHIL